MNKVKQMDKANLAPEIAQLYTEPCSALANLTRLLILYPLAEQAATVNELTEK